MVADLDIEPFRFGLDFVHEFVGDRAIERSTSHLVGELLKPHLGGMDVIYFSPRIFEDLCQFIAPTGIGDRLVRGNERTGRVELLRIPLGLTHEAS